MDDYWRKFGHFIKNDWYKPEGGNQWQSHNPLTGMMCRNYFVPKGVHENRKMGVEKNVAGRLKLDVFLECVYFLKAKDNDF